MFKTLLRHVGRFRTASLLTPLFTALEVVMGVLIPYATSWIIDRGIMAGSLPDVVRYGALMLLMAACSMLFGVLAGRFAALASTGFAFNVRQAMFRNIQTFSFSNIDRFTAAGLVTRMTTDVSNLQNAYQQLLRVSVRAPLNLIFSVLMCVFINWQMSTIFAVALVVLSLSLYLILSRTVRLFAQVFERYDALNTSVQENVQAIRVVKAFVREEFESEKFQRAARALYRLFVRTESLQAINHPVMMLVVYGCIIALSWFGARQIVGGQLTTGQLTSLFAYVMSILMSLMMLSMIFVTLTMSAASGRRVTEVLDERADITSPADAVQEVKDGSVEFRHVTFGYGPEAAIVDINLSIGSGETLGVIGGTGSGKSTLCSLVSRLYDVGEGCVAVGGVDVRRYDVDVLRREVAVVLQQNQLFSGTILDNLRWGRSDATLEECQEACRVAQADEFIRQMPQQYDTLIEQGGTNVSGGQRQRLCIARALLRRPKILILDDSTSACDTATDARIRQGLRSALPGTTKLIVAQRIQSVQDADRIVVMDGGRIAAVGTHQQLLEQSEIYREIYETQMNRPTPTPPLQGGEQ